MLAPLIGGLVNERTLLKEGEVSSVAVRFTQAADAVDRWRLDLWSTADGNGQRSLAASILTGAPALGARTSRIVAVASIPGTVRWDITATVLPGLDGLINHNARAELLFSASEWPACCGVHAMNDATLDPPDPCLCPPGPPGPAGPAGPPGAPGVILKSHFGEVVADTATASLVFVPLMTLGIALAGANRIIMHATFAASATLIGVGCFRLTLDGVPVRGSAMGLSIIGDPESGAIVFRTLPLAAGPHSVALEWRVLAGVFLLQIRPVTQPDCEHASLLLFEATP